MSYRTAAGVVDEAYESGKKIANTTIKAGGRCGGGDRVDAGSAGRSTPIRPVPRSLRTFGPSTRGVGQRWRGFYTRRMYVLSYECTTGQRVRVRCEAKFRLAFSSTIAKLDVYTRGVNVAR